MPFINSKVSVPLSQADRDTLKSRLGEAVRLIPGKSQQWLMVGFEDNYPLYFQGKNEDKMAFVEVKLFGHASGGVYDKMTAALCGIYQEVLGIDPGKIYIQYEETEHWGWNGSNL